jgi:hypothetical protein
MAARTARADSTLSKSAKRSAESLVSHLAFRLLLIAVMDLSADLTARPLVGMDVRVSVAGTERLYELVERPGFDSSVWDCGEYISGIDLACDGASIAGQAGLSPPPKRNAWTPPLTER